MGSFVDAGGDPVTITASVGSVTQDDLNGSWSWSFATTDGVDDSQVVTITATDEDGDSSTVTFQLNVNNVAPAVAASNVEVTVTEGATASNSGIFSDVGFDDVTLVASAGVIAQDDQAGTWSWIFSSTDGPDESQQVDITATDSDGAQTATSFQLVVDNVSPTVSADNSAVIVNEGTTATNTGTMADIGDDTVLLTASVGSITDNNDGTWSWSFASTDGSDQTQPVTITATDDEGAATTTSFTLIVNNVAPSLSADNLSVVATEGAIASNTGQFNDVGDDVVTLSASFGEVVDAGNGMWSWSWTATDGPDDTSAVTITATDDDGTSTNATFFLQVDNVAPTLSVDSPAVTASEGSVAGNSGSLGDAGNDVVTISASIGTVVDNGNGTWNWSYPTNDGPEDSQTVTVTVTDSDNVSTSVDFSLAVENAAPTVVFESEQVIVTEGATANNSGTFSDAGDDVLTLSVSTGTITDDGDGTWTWSYDTLDGPDQSQVVSVTVEDEDQAVTVQTFQLSVTNAAPVLSSDVASVTTTEGSGASNTGTVADFGQDDFTLAASIGTVTLDQGVWTWAYDSTDGPDDGQQVTITATDSDGAEADTTFELVVENIAPAITVASATVSVAEGSATSNSGVFSDIGADTVNVSADFGVVTPDNELGTWSWDWTPANGPASQQITVTATDSDGAQSSLTFDATVDNVAPTLTVDNATVTVSEAATATNTGTMADAGDDELALSASIGTVAPGENGTWQWQYTAIDGPAQETVTITIVDADGATSQTTFDLTVNNVAPEITADNATVTVNEAGTGSNTGTFMDVGASDIVTLAASRGTIVDNGNGTWNWTYTPTDGPDDSGVVTVTATDSNNDQSSTQFDIIVNNVAPEVNANQAMVSATEGQTATNTGTYGDAGIDGVTLSVSIGLLTDNGDGTWSWSYDTVDGPDNSATIVVTATDSDGAVSTAEFGLVVENAAPTVAADTSNVSTTEGSPVTNTGTYADAGGDEVTLTASSGAVTDNGDGTWSWTQTPTNGPSGSGPVTITATDSDGGSAAASFQMEVVNVAPTLSVNSVSVVATESEMVTNTGTVGDIGDDVVQLSVSIGAVENNGDGTWTWSHTPADGPDTASVSITALDEDGGSETLTFDLTINNKAPSLGVNNAEVTATQGVVASNSGTFGDGPTDDVQLTASIGQIVNNADGTWSWTLSTSGTPSGISTVDITATDSDGESTSVAFNLAIQNAPPIVTVDNSAVTTAEGSTASNTGTLGDPGNDEVTIAASTGSVVDNGDGTWSWSSPVADGPDESATITITVTDAQEAASSITFQSIANNIAPVVGTDSSNVEVFEGQTATNTGTYADNGVDTVILSASIGQVVDNNDGTWSWSVIAANGPMDSQTVTITATDSDQFESATSFELVVNNVAPGIDIANLSTTVNEGETASNIGSFGDAGADTLILSASVGEIVDAGNGLWGWTYTPADGPEEQTVSLTVSDGDGGVTSTSFQLVTNNSPPVAAADLLSVNAVEGEQVINTGTFSDPGTDMVTIEASIGTVTVDEEVGTWSWTHVPSDGPDSQTVTITATDSDGAPFATSFALEIANAIPNVVSNQVSVTVSEGQTATNAGSFSDVAADTLAVSASLGTIVDNGDGAWLWSYVPTNGSADSQTVTISASDEDGGVGSATFELAVENFAPTVVANTGFVSIVEGETATNTGVFGDIDSASVALSASVGTLETNENGTWSWSFDTSNGPEESQTVVITATDSDGSTATATFDLSVANLPPTLTVGQALVPAVVGGIASTVGTWEDFGGNEVTLTASIGEVALTAEGTWSWQLADAQLSQAVTITATDDDGAIGSVTFDLLAQLPSVSVDGHVAIIIATDTDDEIFVNLGPTTHSLTVSGHAIELDATMVTELHIGGGLGDDSITVNGTAAQESILAIGGRVTIETGAYSLDTYGINSVTFDGVSGGDIAELTGSDNVDRFEGALSDVALTTPEFSYRMINVDRVNAFGTGGADVADLQGTESNEFFASLPTHSYIENPSSGTKNYLKGFEQIAVDGLGATDYLYVSGSEQDDQFTQYDTHAEFSTLLRQLTLFNFEVSTFDATGGGSDHAVFQIAGPTNSELISTPTDLNFSLGAINSRAVGFETTQASASGDAVHTARIEQVTAVETLFASGSQATMPSRELTLDGFDAVVAVAATGQSPTLDDDEPHDFLIETIGDWL